MLRVTAENQNEAPDAFRPWHVVTGVYGGRLGNDGLGTAAENPGDSPPSPVQRSTEENFAWCNCNAPPFSVPAPASLVAAVSDALEANNNTYVESKSGDQQGWETASALTMTIIPPCDPLAGDGAPWSVIDSTPGDAAGWSVTPQEEWFDTPTSRRPAVGCTLLHSARTMLGDREQAGGTGANTAEKSLWADPLVISYHY